MATRDIRCSITIDEKVAVYLRISAIVHCEGFAETTVEVSQVDGRQYLLTMSAVAEMFREVMDRSARYPHATGGKTGETGRSGDGDNGIPKAEIVPP